LTLTASLLNASNPEVGEEFVSLCEEMDPHGMAMDFKWAALRLRKMRIRRSTYLFSFKNKKLPDVTDRCLDGGDNRGEAKGVY
jgi:hypothetical protein